LQKRRQGKDRQAVNGQGMALKKSKNGRKKAKKDDL
jgi:hypothetical protein